MTFIVDAHQDLAWNVLTFGRDYSRSAHETRRLENGTSIAAQNGDTLLGWEDYQRGNIAILFGTLFASPLRKKMGEWDVQAFRDSDEAHRLYRNQADVYQRMVDEHPDQFRLIRARADLESTLEHWNNPRYDHHPVGIVMLMECAEAIRSMDDLAMWREFGLRIIGPAWAGTRFCGGTREPGPLTREGRELLGAMADQGLALDLSHMDREAALQALDEFPGAIIASHANLMSLLPGISTNRHLTDDVVDGIIARDGVIGVIPANHFLLPGWLKADGDRKHVSLTRVADHIDTICQRAGNARHAAIGSDFDGGFGLQHVPHEIDTVADLQLLAPMLSVKGYSDQDIAMIFGGNWVEFLRRILPAS
jgi:membrane dipeptidase